MVSPLGRLVCNLDITSGCSYSTSTPVLSYSGFLMGEAHTERSSDGLRFDLVHQWTVPLRCAVCKRPRCAGCVTDSGGRASSAVDFKAPHIQWLSLPHTRVGGVTTSRADVGFSGLPHLTFPPDLKRTIGNVLKYSIRPQPCSPDLLDPPHLSISSLLPVSRIRLPVLYPTHFPTLAGAFAHRPIWNCHLLSNYRTAWSGTTSSRLTSSPSRFPGPSLTPS